MNDVTGQWTTSEYYSKGARSLVRTFNNATSKRVTGDNDAVADLSVTCVNKMGMGRDHITDMLSVTLSAKGTEPTMWQSEMEVIYVKLDRPLLRL